MVSFLLYISDDREKKNGGGADDDNDDDGGGGNNMREVEDIVNAVILNTLSRLLYPFHPLSSSSGGRLLDSHLLSLIRFMISSISG